MSLRSQRISTCVVSVGEQSVIIADSVRSQRYVGNVLGVETTSDGRQQIYLDRLLHDTSMVFDGWEASGAISTVLTQAPKEHSQ